MKEHSTAVAYPGVPVVFAEGFRTVDGRRISMHAHASLALTGISRNVRTETKATSAASGVEFTVNGKPLSGERGMGILSIVSEMLSKAGVKSGVKIESTNYGILTGSSDSGAAALAVALNGLLELNLTQSELCEFGRLGSETVYRSVIGGLSEYALDGGAVKVSRIKTAAELSDIAVYGVQFNLPRHTADDIHSKVVSHPSYAARTAVAEERVRIVKEYSGNRNFVGILELMESEAREVHAMFDEAGVPVLKPQMKKLCDSIESMRKNGVKCFWNVAGGSSVYAYTLKRYSEAVESELEDRGYRFIPMRVAGPAAVLES
ncbi:MAG: hypothetical protein NTU61_02205 [Candidatus Altiarchaeota archaeon]|nr:hypothetical protein [Candidatus Altiarchaeota archaeon]